MTGPDADDGGVCVCPSELRQLWRRMFSETSVNCADRSARRFSIVYEKIRQENKNDERTEGEANVRLYAKLRLE